MEAHALVAASQAPEQAASPARPPLPLVGKEVCCPCHCKRKQGWTLVPPEAGSEPCNYVEWQDEHGRRHLVIIPISAP